MLEKPYTIRGHHLPFYAALVRKDTPSLPHEEIHDLFERIHFLAGVEALCGEPNETHSRDYFFDVFGNSSQKMDMVKTRMERCFQNFLQLPQRRNVYITEGQEGNFCKQTAGGTHCPMLYHSEDKLMDTIHGDGLFLNNVVATADRLHIPYRMFERRKIFSDDPTKLRRTIRTLVTNKEHAVRILQDEIYLKRQKEIQDEIENGSINDKKSA